MRRKVLAIALSLALAASVMPQAGVASAAEDPAYAVAGEGISLKGVDGAASKVILADDTDASGDEAASGSAAETEDEGLSYEVTDDYYDVECVMITGYNGTLSTDTLTIPDSIDGYPVRVIEDGAFVGMDFKKVVLPDTLWYIGGGAFERCKKLQSVEIPADVKEIGYSVFEECEKLKTVWFKGNKIKEIPSNAFARCKKLERVALPSSVKTIEHYAFYRCSKLSSISLPKKLINIEEYAFAYDFALGSIDIPASVNNIQESVFKHCTSLKKVKFSGKHTRIDKHTFDGCTSLKKINISDDMKYVPEFAFYNCRSLKNVKLSKNTKLIKRCAFKLCESLRKIKLTKKIYAIGDRAFQDSGIRKIKLNKDLQYIGNGAFSETDLKNIKLTGKVSYIGNRVFAGCRKLKSISIPASVKGLNPGALGDCTSLTSINVSAGNSNYSSVSGVLFDKDRKTLLQYPINKKGSSYTVPSSVEVIRSHSFENNKHLKSVTVSADKIHNHAFNNMAGLKKVVIGNGVYNIASRAFSDNDSLGTVVMADSVRVIAGAAFAGSAIKRIRIPSGIDKLSSDAFEDCDRLEAFEGSSSGKYPVIDGVLYENGGRTLREYPRRKADATFFVPRSVTKIEYGAIYGVKKLKKLFFENTIKDLASNSIANCSTLKEIVFADGTKLRSGWSAVEDCDRLAVIVGPNQSILVSMANNANATLITL